jgi:hypothetical protein
VSIIVFVVYLLTIYFYFLVFISTRQIKENEEITFNYDFFSSERKKCLCGASNCKGLLSQEVVASASEMKGGADDAGGLGVEKGGDCLDGSGADIIAGGGLVGAGADVIADVCLDGADDDVYSDDGAETISRHHDVYSGDGDDKWFAISKCDVEAARKFLWQKGPDDKVLGSAGQVYTTTIKLATLRRLIPDRGKDSWLNDELINLTLEAMICGREVT